MVELLKCIAFGLLIVLIWTLFWYTAWMDGALTDLDILDAERVCRQKAL